MPQPDKHKLNLLPNNGFSKRKLWMSLLMIAVLVYVLVKTELMDQPLSGLEWSAIAIAVLAGLFLNRPGRKDFDGRV